MKVFFCSLFLAMLSINAMGATRVIIDPGHGGKDHGARYYGVTESEINLEVAKYLQDLLDKHPGFEAILTRHKDKFLSLLERAKFAKYKGGDLFISIHANAFNRPQARGAEFYFQNQLPPDEESMFLASQENDNNQGYDHTQWPLLEVKQSYKYTPEMISILKDLQLNQRIIQSSLLTQELFENWVGPKKEAHRSIKQAPFFVISNVNMPSSLIELGYLSNKKEARQLNDPKLQKAYALSIYNGLLKYKEKIDKQQSHDLD